MDILVLWVSAKWVLAVGAQGWTVVGVSRCVVDAHAGWVDREGIKSMPVLVVPGLRGGITRGFCG